MINNRQELIERIVALLGTIEKTKFCSYDPFDGLNSPPLFLLSKKFPLIGRFALFVVKASPLNLRRALGIKKVCNDPKVISDVIRSYVNLYHTMPKEEYVSKAICLAQLLFDGRNRSTQFFSWGLKFPYYSRFTISINTPNLFTTVNAALAITELYQLTRKEEYRSVLDSINRFIVKELGFVWISSNSGYIRYYPALDVAIYNVNALALKYLQMYSNIFDDNSNELYMNAITSLLCEKQNESGSWYYSDGDKGHWVDGFHTGYIIEGLLQRKGTSSDKRVLLSLKKAVLFYKGWLIKDNFPHYYAGKRFPIDTQNCAQAIQTRCLLQMSQFDELESIKEMVQKIDEALYCVNGDYYYFRKYPLFTNKNFYLRWSQSPMLLALTHFLRIIND